MKPNAAAVAASLNAVSKLPGSFVVLNEAGGLQTVQYQEGRTGEYQEVYKHYVNITQYGVVMRRGHGNAKRLTEYRAINEAGGLSPEDAKKIVATVRNTRAKFVKNVRRDIAYWETRGAELGLDAPADSHAGRTIREVADMYRSFIAGM